MKFPRKKKGFTLIELLVVVSIIGILAIIIISSLSSARNRAEDVTLFKKAQELQKAVELYNLDNGEFPESGNINTAYGYVGTNCEDFSSQYNDNWDYMIGVMGDYLPDSYGNFSGEFPNCIFYTRDANSSACDEIPNPKPYLISVGLEDTEFNTVDFFMQNDHFRYCLYPL